MQLTLSREPSRREPTIDFGVPVTLSATATGVGSTQPLFRFAAWAANVAVEYGTPLATSGDFSASARWTWTAPLAGLNVKFTATMKLPSPGGEVEQTMLIGPYQVVEDAHARALFSTRIAPVFTFHRCVSCHNGADSPTQGDDRHVHVPAVNRDVDCRQCHGEENGEAVGSPPGAPGHWALPPKESAFVGKSPAQLCRQLKDPALTGGRTLAEVREHVRTDPIVQWTWDPGPGRTRSPYTWDNTVFDYHSAFATWVRIGAACPDESATTRLGGDAACCSMVANPAMRGRLGRLIVAFPADADPRSTRVAVFLNGEEVQAGYGSGTWDLLSGSYDVTISGKRLANVAINAAHDTHVRVGVLRVTAASQTRVEVLEAGEVLTGDYGEHLVGLPSGTYQVRVAGQSERVQIDAGKVTDF